MSSENLQPSQYNQLSARTRNLISESDIRGLHQLLWRRGSKDLVRRLERIKRSPQQCCVLTRIWKGYNQEQIAIECSHEWRKHHSDESIWQRFAHIEDLKKREKLITEELDRSKKNVSQVVRAILEKLGLRKVLQDSLRAAQPVEEDELQPVQDAKKEIRIPFEVSLDVLRLLNYWYDLNPELSSNSVDDFNLALSQIRMRAVQADYSMSNAAKVFISYKRNFAPDETVALAICEALGNQHQVFIDQTMVVGTKWVEHIADEIRQADALIVLLSEQSVQSEMVQHEIKLAHSVATERDGRPLILPVRLRYHLPFPYPLNTFLNDFQWAYWDQPEDTPRLILELQHALSGKPLRISQKVQTVKVMEFGDKVSSAIPNPTPMAQPHGEWSTSSLLEKPEGTMIADSRFYVERSEDIIALECIQDRGVTVTIKGARQMGKSSLLIRIMNAATQAGKRVAFIDFQTFDSVTLREADDFFQQFCLSLTDALDLEDRVEEYWQSSEGNRKRCSRYVLSHILSKLRSPLVLAMDEVESIFDTSFRTDFFGMLRYWHNERAINPLWKQLDLVLVTSTEPYQLIEDLNQSPFNVGEVLELQDFSFEQVHDLNQRHHSPLTPLQTEQLMNLVNGHPYLVRKALYLVASQRMTATELFEQAAHDRGPFGDHLRHHLFRLYNKPDLVAALFQVIRSRNCPDQAAFFRLRGAGLIRRDTKGVVPRCQLYVTYFQEYLRG